MGVLDKLLLPVSGIPLLRRTVSSVLPCVQQIIVVVSLRLAADVTELLESDAIVVVNPKPEDGMGSSIATGVRTAIDAAGYLILPGDMPVVKSDTIARLVEHFEANPDQITVPVRDGRRGQPVIFPSWAKVDLCTLAGDAGSNFLVDQNPSRIFDVQVGDPGIWRDIDRPDDYHALVSSM
jgi:molybdenum cofactor cytidylyltransferase